jgi:hypothetical protein
MKIKILIKFVKNQSKISKIILFIYFILLKLIVIFAKLAFLYSQNYILNIEKGDNKVSKYVEAMKPI